MLSQQALNEFKEIYKSEFGEEIDDKTALDLATRLLNLMKVIYRPIKPNHQ